MAARSTTDIRWRELGWGTVIGGLVILTVAVLVEASAVSIVLASLITLGGVAAVLHARRDSRSER